MVKTKISVLDKEHAALGATEEEQDVSALPRIVVPMGAFNDPNNPLAAAGSVNYPLGDHPVEHSEDYGADVEPGTHQVGNAMGDADGGDTASSADRSEWKKADWQKRAKQLDLAVSGNLDALQKRVEEHEKAETEYAEWEAEVNSASRDELDKMAPDYNLEPSEYSTKEDLAAAIIAAENAE